MKKIVVHIGAPKTATTSIQKGLFTKLADKKKIMYLGKDYKNPPNYNILSIRDYILYGNIAPSLKTDMKLIEDTGKMVVLSNENFLVQGDGHDSVNNKKPLDIYSSAKRMNEIFKGNFNTHILFMMRAQSTMLYSYYVEMYKWKYRHIDEINTFSKYLKLGIKESKHFSMFNYDLTYDIYANFFGKKNVHILFYEDMVNDFHSFCLQFEKATGFQATSIEKYLQKAMHNKTKVIDGTYWSDASEAAEKGNGSIQLDLVAGSQVSDGSAPIVKPTPEEYLAINDYFKPGNLKLVNKLPFLHDKMISYSYI